MVKYVYGQLRIQLLYCLMIREVQKSQRGCVKKSNGPKDFISRIKRIALACSSHFLNSRTPVLSSLTHLHRAVYVASEIVQIAALLGPQLLSLRLEASLDLGVAGAAGTELRWSLGEVAARFPRLRYLQVDSPYVRRSIRLR